jgi:Mrp family chromosome partitioning ATPase
LEAALALGHLHAGEIMLVKPDLLQGLRVQGGGDEAHANTIELPDLPELFEVVNHPKLLTLSAWRHLRSADRLSISLLTILRSVCKHFRLIIVECPPLLQSADAAVLASNCEGVIIVLDNLRHTRSELRDAQAELQRLNAPFLGAVLSSQKTRRRFLRSR